MPAPLTTQKDHFNLSSSPITSIKTDKELEEIYKSVADGIVTLRDQSEAFGDHVSTNRARLLFLALSMFLDDQGIIEHMAMCTSWAHERMTS